VTFGAEEKQKLFVLLFMSLFDLMFLFLPPFSTPAGNKRPRELVRKKRESQTFWKASPVQLQNLLIFNRKP
jgi:hypothetical protein